MTLLSPEVYVLKTDHTTRDGVTKRCPHCGIFQDISAFWGKGKDGWCKYCRGTKGEREPLDPFAPYRGDTHKHCGGQLIPYSADFDGIVMSCSECRMAGLVV